MRLVYLAILTTAHLLSACAVLQNDAPAQPQATPARGETPPVGVLLPLATSDAPTATLPPLEPTPTAQPKPTVTLVGRMSPLPTPAARRAEGVILRLVGGYGGVPFELRYDPAVWRLIPDVPATLAHTSIPGCVFDPQAGGRGADEPMSVEKRMIAGYEFEVRSFFGDNLASFILSLPEGYYLFVIDFIDPVPRETFIRCREEAAKLL
ncbi:MAG: hypothetical protein NZ693_03410, partial [Thermoflexales bacterium]|nr:hypothetical protein [Thermoflexales bacterium]